jgi:hypothetical protein
MTTPTNPYPGLRQTIDPTILRGIQQASQATSTDFGLMMAQASQESGFHADAKSSTSSASGLYQFVDSTWLDMMRRFGAKYGAGQLAQQIGQDATGKAVVSDPAVRQKILALRQDPALSASLAGEYTKSNQTEVEQALGHPVQRADLYMAHFLGASGATTFLKAVETKGSTVAADLLPEAAAANKSIFFDAQTGKARTVSEIYHSLAAKIEKAASDLGGLASANTPVIPANASVAAAAPSSLGGKLGWSAAKLSNTILSMLNILALTALNTDGSEPTMPYSPASPTQPRERRSI